VASSSFLFLADEPAALLLELLSVLKRDKFSFSTVTLDALRLKSGGPFVRNHGFVGEMSGCDILVLKLVYPRSK
jgi:hypothetical protein